MLTTCTSCNRCYEVSGSEAADEPGRLCLACTEAKAARSERQAYTRRIVTAMQEDLQDTLRAHGKDSPEYVRQLEHASRSLRGSLPELLQAYLDYSSSSPR